MKPEYLKVTDLGSHHSRTINLHKADNDLLDSLRNYVLFINGNGMSEKGTANAMHDMACIMEGSLPFTRNGHRFEVGQAPATGDAS